MKTMFKMIFALYAALVSIFAFGTDFHAEAKSRTEPREFIGTGGKIFRYRWAEKVSKGGGKSPLVVFLHGAGERGTNNVSQLIHGVGELICWMDAHENGYRLVAGQVPHDKRWVEVNWNAKSHDMPEEPSETMLLLMEFLDRQLADPVVDASRVYVTGLSMGGYGTWDVVCRRPDVFAAAMPICGGADTAQATKIVKVPIWAFHGSADGVVSVCRSRDMVSALWAVGSNVHYREYPDAGHDIWARTYGDQEVLDWFFRQRNNFYCVGEAKKKAEEVRGF